MGSIGRQYLGELHLAWRKNRRIIAAKAKAQWLGYPLPPGGFVRFDPAINADRKALIALSERVGPILSTVWGDRIQFCVVCIATARRLLTQHQDDLNAISIDLRSIIPEGFLRTMEGDDHKRYRKLFARAMAGTATASTIADARSIIDEGLNCLRSDGSDISLDRGVLKRIALRLLMRSHLGLRTEEDALNEIERHFLAMGPEEFVWNVGESQKTAFFGISDRLIALLSNDRPGCGVDPDSVLGRLAASERIEQTVLGNLIYMVEMGRSDLESLFGWIVRFTGNDRETLTRIAAGERSPTGRPISEAVVLETLRMEQTVGLMRSAKRDFVFDGYLIPEGCGVRVCLWETHKRAQNFEHPLTFNADRFMRHEFAKDQFCPFGIGHHICPAADSTLQIAALFVQAYAQAIVAGGPPP